MIQELTSSQVLTMCLHLKELGPKQALKILESEESALAYLTTILPTKRTEDWEEPRYHPDDPTPGELVSADLETQDEILEMIRDLNASQYRSLWEAFAAIHADAAYYVP